MINIKTASQSLNMYLIYGIYDIWEHGHRKKTVPAEV